MGKRKGKHLDVYWFLPNKKKAFYYSTKATCDLVKVLYDEYGDLRLVYDNIHYDEDAKRIVKAYIDAGIYEAHIN